MRTLFGLFLFFCVLNDVTPADLSPDRRVLTDTIARTFIGGEPHKAGTVTRQLLTSAELGAKQPVHFVLKLRNFDELQVRIQRGDVISPAELTARYFPTHETWTKVAAWARAQGFTVNDEDTSRMTVFASSSVTQVEAALQMKFARVVGTDGREYSSAITPPAIPAELGDSVIGVLKLQPHLRPIRKQTVTPIVIDSDFISPTAIAQLYNATGLGLDGTGQTIVILGEDRVNSRDLTEFWQTCSVPATVAQFTEIDPDPANLGSNNNADEETMDIEWASAMAPGAKIIYFSSIDPEVFTSWLFNRQSTDHSLNQVSESFGLTESLIGQNTTTSQYYAVMAATGVTFFAATGDYGSTTSINANFYDPNGMTAPGYPASDPYVTAVGGTTVGFALSASGNPQLPITEGGWCLPNSTAHSADLNDGASTGGLSWFFARPSWQAGMEIPSGTMRCVPDVAAMAMGNFPGPYVFQGVTQMVSGTSQSSPIWAGLCTLINQARANAGLSPLGLLGPKIYLLNGTPAFNQMTTGSSNVTDGFVTTASNGVYTVGPNYNLVTGLGSPNLGNLIAALTTQVTSAVPVITTQPTPQTVAQGGTATFTVAASGTPAPGLQWTVNGIAVLDGPQPDYSTASGSTTKTLTISNAQTTGPVVAIATNATGVTTSNAVTLTVNLPTPPVAMVTTVAGSGFAGSTDGQPTGIVASFNNPRSVAVDASGNVYIADAGNCVIRKIDSAGVVTTLAGSGSPGSTDGTGTAARFNGPSGVAVDASGNVYVADTYNNEIRMVSPAGVVTTLAGSSSPGLMDGTGTAARFNGPSGVAVNASGNVYVADPYNNEIRMVSPAGVVTTLAGTGSSGSTDGTGTAARFNWPSGVAVDASGNVYVADTANDNIRKVTPAGIVTTLAGSGNWGTSNGAGTAASFFAPGGVAVDASGNVYVADTLNNEIRKVTPAGIVTTLAGSGIKGIFGSGSSDGVGTAASFNQPSGVAVNSSGYVYVADTANNKIRKVTPAGVVTTLAGTGTAGSVDGLGSLASFNAPGDVAVDASSTVYVADCNNNTIRKVTPVGVVTTLAGSGSAGSTDGTGTAASFRNPTGLAVDASGNVYVTDTDNNKIRKVTPAGVVTTLAGSGSSGAMDGTGTAASFNWPTGPAMDVSGNVYVADAQNNEIRKITPAGVVTTLAGSTSSGWLDGQGTAAGFTDPAGVAVDASGNIYVADAGNGEIRKISPTGTVSTLAGSVFNNSGSTNGSGADASFWGPAGVAVDASGNVYVADSGNNEIRKVSPAGAVITLAGSGSQGSADGSGTVASFNDPEGVAVDASGNVYVADFANNKIRKITQIPEVIPMITWTVSAAIPYGTALSSAQLDATANVPGSFAYTPAAGTVLSLGTQTLRVTFTPTDSTDYTTAAATQTLSVTQGIPVITWATPTAVANGTALSSAQLDATANVPGNFAYTPAAGTVLSVGAQTLSATFMPTDSTDYTTATATQTLLVSAVLSAPAVKPAGDVIANRFTAAWSSVVGATGYHLDVSTSSSFSTFVTGYQHLDVGNVTSANVTGLNPATTYYYRIEAYEGAVAGISSASITVTTTPAVSITTPMTVSTLAGHALGYGNADGTGSTAQFFYPSGVVATDNAGNVYVADTDNNTIRQIVPATGAVTTLAGLAGVSGSADGTGSNARFQNPSGVAVDSAGNVYVADTLNNTLRKVTSAGVVTTLAGAPGAGGSFDGVGSNAQFRGPQSLTVDGASNLFVADTNNHTIRKVVLATGEVTTVAGLAGNPGSIDGSGTAAQFDYPSGIDVDIAGNLYVADTDNNTIRVIAPSGLVRTLAGLAGSSGGADGIGSAATFDSPSAVAVDSSGAVYVADTGNFTIRMVAPATGATTTLAGLAGTSGSTDGIGSAVRFFQPAGIATGSNGNLYIADTDNHTIRLGLMAAAPSIATQPQSQTVTAGNSVQFSVTASGRPAPTYQWNFNGTAINGATSSSYSLASAQSGNAGTYTVTVSNVIGSVTSNPATLTINAAITPPSSDGGGGSGGGGGGGAPSCWFIMALALIGVARFAVRAPRFPCSRAE